MKNECFYLICLIGLLSSCNFDNFHDLEPVNVDAEFAVPLFDSRISIADVMEGASENVSVRIEDDNSVSILPNNKWIFSTVVSKQLSKRTEVSIFVENIFNDRADYRDNSGSYVYRNPEIFWGLTFSSMLDNIFN